MRTKHECLPCGEAEVQISPVAVHVEAGRVSIVQSAVAIGPAVAGAVSKQGHAWDFLINGLAPLTSNLRAIGHAENAQSLTLEKHSLSGC